MCLLSPTSKEGFTCKCKPGYRITPNGRCNEEETAYLMVMRGSQIIDVSIKPGDTAAGFLTSIVGVEKGRQIEYDRKGETIFWIEGKNDNDDENVSSFVKFMRHLISLLMLVFVEMTFLYVCLMLYY